MCMNHADELQPLVNQWKGLEVITRTQLSEAERAIEKARLGSRGERCTYKVASHSSNGRESVQVLSHVVIAHESLGNKCESLDSAKIWGVNLVRLVLA